jgi:ribosomal protein L9
MQIILLENIMKLGKIGDQVEIIYYDKVRL